MQIIFSDHVITLDILKVQAISNTNMYIYIYNLTDLCSYYLPYIDGLVQDCSNSSALAMELL